MSCEVANDENTKVTNAVISTVCPFVRRIYNLTKITWLVLYSGICVMTVYGFKTETKIYSHLGTYNLHLFDSQHLSQTTVQPVRALIYIDTHFFVLYFACFSFALSFSPCDTVTKRMLELVITELKELKLNMHANVTYVAIESVAVPACYQCPL